MMRRAALVLCACSAASLELDDAIAAAQLTVKKPVLATVSASRKSKAKLEVNNIATKLVKVASDGFNLHAPQVMQWMIAGKLTDQAMSEYTKPRTVAKQNLVDTVLDMAYNVFSKNLTNTSGDEIMRQLAGPSTLRKLARQYAQDAGRTSLVESIDALDNTLKDIPLNEGTADKVFDTVADQLQGIPLVDLAFYLKNAAKNHSQWDPEQAMELATYALEQLGFPPATTQYLRQSAWEVRNNIDMFAKQNQGVEVLRLDHAVLSSAKELKLAYPLVDILNWTMQGHSLEMIGKYNATEYTSAMLMLYSYLVSGTSGPFRVATLLNALAYQNMYHNITYPDMVNAFAMAVEESYPKSIGRLVRYVAGVHGGLFPTEPGRSAELVGKIIDEVKLPQAFTQMAQNLGAIQKRGVEPTREELFQMFVQTLRRANMASAADVMAKIIGPMAKGEKLNPELLKSMLPTLLGLPHDIAALNQASTNLATTFGKPLDEAIHNMGSTIIHDMPESPLKSFLDEKIGGRPGKSLSEKEEPKEEVK